jgi:TolB-like protein
MENGQRKLAAIMFTDIVGYCALSNKNEALALELLREHNDLLRPVLNEYNGREIKTIGDAFLVEFASALEAVSCGVEIQRRMNDRNEKEDIARLLKIRIGVHLGDILHQDNDVFGDGVNIASRIEPLAAPGGICFSRQVYDQVRNKIEDELVSAGQFKLKNIKDPVEIFYARLPWDEDATTVATPHAEDAQAKSIVVLPFTDMSREKDQEYFCDGIAEDIIDALSKVDGVKTVARSSAFAFKNKNMDVRDIGKTLNVENVVEGSVQKAGNKLRITSQFVKASDGCHVWSDKYDRDMEDIFAIQDEISFAVVDKLRIKLLGKTKSKIAKRSTENVEAYTTYLKGRYFWNRRRKGDMEKSLTFFQQAIEMDPYYALPYAGIADTYTMLGTYGFLPPTETYPKAKEFANKALQLDEELGDAYTSLAWIAATYGYEKRKALELFEKAKSLNPKSPYTHSWYGLYLMGLSRFEEAISELQSALEIDPLSMIFNGNLGMIYSFSGDQEKAIGHYKRSLEIDPGFSLGHIWLGMAYLGKNELDQAIDCFERAISLEGDGPLALGYLGFTLALANRRQEAESILKRFNNLSTGYIHPYCEALIHIGLKNFDECFNLVEKAFTERDPLLIYLPFMPELVPALKTFATDPRFIGLIQKMGIRDYI